MNQQKRNGIPSALEAAERSSDERSETERSGAAPKAGHKMLPNPEVRPRAKRRSFPAQYKLKILAEADAATGSGAIGALLRREGLYSSMLTNWRKERAAAIEQGLAHAPAAPNRNSIHRPRNSSSCAVTTNG